MQPYMSVRFHILQVLFGCILIFRPADARQATISGSEPGYAGCVLAVCTIDNYISATDIKLGECTVAANGAFSVQIPCKSTQTVYMRLGVFKAHLCVEPGFDYEVKLPPRTDKTPEEAASPFFQYAKLYLSTIQVKDNRAQTIPSGSELNMQLMVFNSSFNPLYDQLAVDAARRKPVRTDSIISGFKQGIHPANSSYFNSYAFYRTGLLYYAAQQNGVKYISNMYFAKRPVLYDNEAYMELFNITYDKYFMYFGRSKAGEEIYTTINQEKSFSGLKRLLGQDGILPGDSLRELVIIKNICDEFYADRFSRQSLLLLLDSAIVQTKIERHKEIAGQVRSKITRLLRGFEPPVFSLYNQDSIPVTLQSYRGKYLYLMFCTTQNYVCISQYELLKNLYDMHGKWLQIAVVSADDSFAHMRDVRQKNRFQWDFLHIAGDPDILGKYDVRIFPTCYLIDPAGKLVLSPAPAAGDNIEWTLYQELQNKKLWDEYVKKGWIVDQKRTDKRFELDLGVPSP